MKIKNAEQKGLKNRYNGFSVLDTKYDNYSLMHLIDYYGNKIWMYAFELY